MQYRPYFLVSLEYSDTNNSLDKKNYEHYLDAPGLLPQLAGLVYRFLKFWQEMLLVVISQISDIGEDLSQPGNFE